MKVKRIPEDFQVEEETLVRPSGGRFALYRLAKRWIGTPEAIQEILDRWHLPRDRVAYGGLKDYHAVTGQHITIDHGPKREFVAERFRLEYLGQVPRPFTAGDIAANRFTIILRDLDPTHLPSLRARWQEIQQSGVPNYFDDQRMGSLGPSGEFVAQPWCRGDWERAVWLALAEPNVHDQPRDCEEKGILRELWNDWSACKAALPRSHRRSIVTFLDDRPGDFRGALARIRIDLRSIYAAAFQSAVWNTMLDIHLRAACPAEALTDRPFRQGRLAVFHTLPAEVHSLLDGAQLPLPSARLKLDAGPLFELVAAATRKYGLEPREMRFKYPRDTFFSKGLRSIILAPLSTRDEPLADDRHRGRSALRLSFALPRGAYATMILKCLDLESGVTWDEDDAADAGESAGPHAGEME